MWGNVLYEDGVIGGDVAGAVSATVAAVEGEMEEELLKDESEDEIFCSEDEPEAERVIAGDVSEGEAVDTDCAQRVIGGEGFVAGGEIKGEKKGGRETKEGEEGGLETEIAEKEGGVFAVGVDEGFERVG